MRSFVYALAFTIGGAVGASATELEPIQAGAISIGPVEGVVYYTVEEEGLRVVTTVSAGQATSLRVVSVLDEDQNVVLAVPGQEGEGVMRIRIERRDDGLQIEEPAMAMK